MVKINYEKENKNNIAEFKGGKKGLLSPRMRKKTTIPKSE